jgi:hypothetical protein
VRTGDAAALEVTAIDMVHARRCRAYEPDARAVEQACIHTRHASNEEHVGLHDVASRDVLSRNEFDFPERAEQLVDEWHGVVSYDAKARHGTWIVGIVKPIVSFREIVVNGRGSGSVHRHPEMARRPPSRVPFQPGAADVGSACVKRWHATFAEYTLSETCYFMARIRLIIKKLRR